MTLPVSGLISLSQVNVELGFASNTLISLNQAAVRTLFAKPSGTIALSDGYSKSAPFVFNPTIGTTQNYNLKAAAIAAGWNQTTPLSCTATVSPGAVVGSSSTGAYAFDTGITFPVGSILSLVVGSGAYIVGAGGTGNSPGSAVAGGPAMRAQYALTVTNNGVIGGGGGGGGPCLTAHPDNRWASGSGGAGNNPGIVVLMDGGGYNGEAGATSGTLTAGGGTAPAPKGASGPMIGYGGNLGAAGGYGLNFNTLYGGTSAGVPLNNGGAGGAAVVGNGNITWAVVGTRYGALT